MAKRVSKMDSLKASTSMIATLDFSEMITISVPRYAVHEWNPGKPYHVRKVMDRATRTDEVNAFLISHAEKRKCVDVGAEKDLKGHPMKKAKLVAAQCDRLNLPDATWNRGGGGGSTITPFIHALRMQLTTACQLDVEQRAVARKVATEGDARKVLKEWSDADFKRLITHVNTSISFKLPS